MLMGVIQWGVKKIDDIEEKGEFQSEVPEQTAGMGSGIHVEGVSLDTT